MSVFTPSHDPSAPSGDVLAAYFSGHCSAEDQMRVDEWRLSDSAAAQAFEAAHRVWQTSGRGKTTASVDRVLEQFRAAVAAESAMSQTSSAPRPSPRTVISGIAVGLATVAMLVVAVSHRPAAKSPARTYRTAAGQQAEVVLEQGIRVVLAPQTTMRVRGTDVVLTGEAFFNVTHRPRTPFVVHAGAVTARVLGTAFEIRHHDDRDAVWVAVTEGRLAVTAPTVSHGVVLTPGRAVEVTDSTVRTQATVDRTSYTDWTADQLVFQQATVSEVLETLGRWYGYQFRVADSTLTTRHMSAAFDGRSLTGTLALLKVTLDVTLTFDGNVVTLRPRSVLTRELPDARREVHDSFSTPHEVGR